MYLLLKETSSYTAINKSGEYTEIREKEYLSYKEDDFKTLAEEVKQNGRIIKILEYNKRGALKVIVEINPVISINTDILMRGS